ncbi:MAG: hypothetical protein HY754_11250 [Nitrospirae bacterium]|nr:hypothetical protein [Nitrospirota bacterium]
MKMQTSLKCQSDSKSDLKNLKEDISAMINLYQKKTFGQNFKYKKKDLLSRQMCLIKEFVILFIQITLITTLIQFTFLTSAFSQTEPSITILKIESDNFIKGKVEGLRPEEYANYKVIVYVKTDKWYIHPYERGGAGRSYANINQDGTWTIGTVKREFPADYVAALLVRSDYTPPSTVAILGTLDYIAIYKEEGKGRL